MAQQRALWSDSYDCLCKPGKRMVSGAPVLTSGPLPRIVVLPTQRLQLGCSFGGWV